MPSALDLCPLLRKKIIFRLGMVHFACILTHDRQFTTPGAIRLPAKSSTILITMLLGADFIHAYNHA